MYILPKFPLLHICLVYFTNIGGGAVENNMQVKESSRVQFNVEKYVKIRKDKKTFECNIFYCLLGRFFATNERSFFIFAFKFKLPMDNPEVCV